MRKHNEPSLEAERDALRKEVARLNQEIRRRQMELDILKKAEEIIKKDPGISISHLNMLANGRWYTVTEVGIIAGQAGWKEWMQQVLFAQCPVKDVHLIMPHAKAFSADWKRKCIMGVNGRASRQKSSCSKWMLASDGIASGV